MIDYVDHVAVTVRDLDRSIKFYTQKMGFSVLRRSETPKLDIVFVGNELARLELFQPKKGIAREVPPLKSDEVGIKHIALHVEDVEGLVEEMRSKGVKFTTDIIRREDRSYIFLQDPDGVTLQLIQG